MAKGRQSRAKRWQRRAEQSRVGQRGGRVDR